MQRAWVLEPQDPKGKLGLRCLWADSEDEPSCQLGASDPDKLLFCL